MHALLVLLLCTASFSAEWYEKLAMPKGFKLEKFADVRGARQMARSPKGIMYVGSMEAGEVSAIGPDGKVVKIFTGLNQPQGVLWHKGDLYIAEISKISKVSKIDETYLKHPSLTAIKSDFPKVAHHGWKTIAIGPDGKLYVPVGAPCNICEEPLPYAALHRMDLDGKNFELVARGIRNTVGFTWHPDTKKLYFTDNGRDMMGNDIPADEINVVSYDGEHFGYPYMHAGDIPDPKFGKNPPKVKMTPPIYKIPAHSAALGIAFFPKASYPAEFHDCFLVAEHGSWNRTSKSGYRVTKGCLKDGKVVSYEPFITGFKEGEMSLGRPVHFLFNEDGSFFLSDDHGGHIFKVSLTK
jgi:glucose/arabinose dehydrogenase